MFTSEQKEQLRNELVSKGISEEKILKIEKLNDQMDREETVSLFIEEKLKEAKHISELPKWSSCEGLEMIGEPSAEKKGKYEISDLDAALNILASAIVHENKKPVEVAHGHVDGKYWIVVRTEAA